LLYITYNHYKSINSEFYNDYKIGLILGERINFVANNESQFDYEINKKDSIFKDIEGVISKVNLSNLFYTNCGFFYSIENKDIIFYSKRSLYIINNDVYMPADKHSEKCLALEAGISQKNPKIKLHIL